MDKIKMMAVVGGMLAAVSCSDFDDFNTVPVAEDPAANRTLWENIASNPDLSEFKAVLERLGYDKVLDASHTYTVWAPVDGSFDSDSLALVSDAKVEKEFLQNMIADYTHRETDPNDTVIYMLNEKLLKFANKGTANLTFDAQRILSNVNNPSVYNYPSSNGLLYVVSTPSVFRYNGYEYIFEAMGADSMKKYVGHYERIYLDEANSVKGDILDGVQHYDDSVLIVRNRLVTDLMNAQLDNEDSLYTVLIPTDEAWVETYNKIASYYKYIDKIDYQDLNSDEVGENKGATVVKNNNKLMGADVGKTTFSLDLPPADAAIKTTGAYWTDSIVKRFLTNSLVFSENNKSYNAKLSTGASFGEKDTLFSTTHGHLTNLPELDAATQEIVGLSNGHARIINRFPFLPEETYAPVIKTNVVSRLVTAVGSTYDRVIWTGPLPDSICVLDDEKEKFMWVETDLPETSNFAPELDFYLPNVLSTTYDVYVVVVPNNLISKENNKPYTLYVDINYTDANNKQIAGRFDGETVQVTTATIKKVEPFEVGQHKVDTIRAGRITFPICYAGTNAMPNIKVTHAISTFMSSHKKKYEQALRIANVILRPVNEEE